MIRLWVHFNLLCNYRTQRRLHNIFRHKIKDWKKRGLVREAVLTYHFHKPPIPTDSLYVCLDIPTVKEPRKRSIHLSTEAIEQTPSEIMNCIRKICVGNQIKLEIMDYEFLLKHNKAWEAYRMAPVKEIIRFASVGTKIALQILDLVEIGEAPWASDKELAIFILTELKKELGENYFWLPEAFHFVCNPLLINDSRYWALAHDRD